MASDLDIAVIEGLIRRRDFAGLSRAARSAPRLPVNVHALAIGLSGQAMDAAASPANPAAVAMLGEAIYLLEGLIHAEPGARTEAEAVGDVAIGLARAWQFAREHRWPVSVVAPADPSLQGRQVLAESARLLQEGQATEAEALLMRAWFHFETAGPEARAFERATKHLARLLRRSLGDTVGAAIRPADVAAEQARDDALLSSPEEELGTYLDVLQEFYAAARRCLRLELAERCLAVGLDAYRSQAKSTGDVGPLAAALAAIGEAALETERLAAAVLAFDELQRLVQAGHCDPSAARESSAGLARAWAALGEPEIGLRALRAALAEAAPGASETLRSSHWLGFYALALDAGDIDAAHAVHAFLKGSGNARGTSLVEIDATRAEPAAAIAAYRALLDAGTVASTFRRVAPRLARLLIGTGQFDEAGSLLDSALPMFEQTARGQTEAMAELVELTAVVQLAQGRPADALERLFHATALDNRIAPQRLGCALASMRARLLAGPRRRAEALLGLVVERCGDRSDLVGSAHAVVMRRKGLNAGIEWEKARRTREAAPRDEELAALGRRLEALRAQLAAASLAFARGETGAVLARADRSESDEVERALICRIGGVPISGLIESANPASVAMTLPAGAKFVDIYRYSPMATLGTSTPAPRYCAFLIEARMLQWKVVDLGAAAKIDRLVSRWRSELAGVQPTSVRFATAVAAADRHLGARRPPAAVTTGRLSAAARLRRRVLGALQHEIAADQRLVVSMDGPLCAVPLECLPAESAGEVIDERTISYASSVRSLTYFRSDVLHDGASEDRGGATPPVVVGDPDYGVAGEWLGFTDLPGSRREACDIAALVGVHAQLDESANKTIVRTARSPLVLHLATHGYVLGAAEAPSALRPRPLLRVGIALAGVNRADGAAEGLLTGEDVLSMDLGRTALTVLSACETGLGEPEHGEGLASLGRAFEIAGSRAVVVGLWRVPDDATSRLMTRFYEQLRSGHGCADALHAAKLELRRTHPRSIDWGAFICLGGWGSIAFDLPGSARSSVA